MKSAALLANGIRWSDTVEAPLRLRLNKCNSSAALRHYFTVVSRLGNGALWYCLLASLPLVLGIRALPLAAHIGATALLGVLIYKFCKRVLVRERPFVTHAEIHCFGVPLDRGSFPSGHTIHATSFTIMFGTLFPPLLWVLVPIALSIALARIVLGHHYPSDVLAGALIGFALALTSLSLLPVSLQ